MRVLEKLPSLILVNTPRYFKLFFQLMQLGGGVTERVWALLMRLPTNNAMRTDLLSLESVKNPNPNWDVLLDR